MKDTRSIKEFMKKKQSKQLVSHEDNLEKLPETCENIKLKPIYLAIKPKRHHGNQKLPRRSKTILPTTSLKTFKNHQKFNVSLSFLLSLLIVIGSYFESKSHHDTNYDLTTEQNILRIIICGLTCLQILLVISYYYTSLKIKISYKAIHKHSNLFQDKDIIRNMFLEIIVCCFIIPPYVKYPLRIPNLEYEEILDVDELLMAFILLRVYHIYKLYYEFTEFNSLRAGFYCNLEMLSSQTKFSVKSMRKASPLLNNFMIFMLSAFVLSVLVNIYDRSIASSPFYYIWNCLWFISYTQYTIGYGDMVPVTHLGRAATILCAFIGIFIYSYTVLIVRNNSVMKNRELQLYSRIKHQAITLQILKKFAIILIQRWWKLCMKRKINAKRLIELVKFQKILHQFSLKRFIASKDKSTVLNEEIQAASSNISKKFRGLNHELDKINISASLSTRYLNLNYSALSKLKFFNRAVRRYLNFGNGLNPGLLKVKRSSARSISSNSGRISIEKLRGDAMKKMMKKKIRMSVASAYNSPVLHLNDDDFYSSRLINKE